MSQLTRHEHDANITLQFDHGELVAAQVTRIRCLAEDDGECIKHEQIQGISFDSEDMEFKARLKKLLGDKLPAALARAEKVEGDLARWKSEAESADAAHRQTIAEKAQLAEKVEPLERGIALRDDTIGLLEANLKAAQERLAELAEAPGPTAANSADPAETEDLRTEIARQDGIIASLLAELRDMRQQATAKGVELKPWSRVG